MTPTNDGLSPEDGFATTVSIGVRQNGTAHEDMLSGNLSEAGPPVDCPTGALLSIPIAFDAELGVGGYATGDGSLLVMGDDPTAVWLATDSVPLEGAPTWLWALADEVRCSDPDGSLAIHFAVNGHYLTPDSTWAAPIGSLSLHGRDDVEDCTAVFFSWAGEP